MNAEKKLKDMIDRREAEMEYRAREYEDCAHELGMSSWRANAAWKLMVRATRRWSLASYAWTRMLTGGRASGRPYWM